MTLVQGLGLYFLGTSGIPALKKFGTLGTVQMEMQFNPLTLKNESTTTTTRLPSCCSA